MSKVDPSKPIAPPAPATPSVEKPRNTREPEDRTLGNRPVDPNAANQKVRIPPGVAPEEVRDPGSNTPGAPPVDNRS
ncbi:hypothetical protein FOZ76_22950 [Verticiella sediminum]|uniref:Uncharacterized protein n=1 Tax=Verticiella sediminum TaxID=1247510 RepID=A0A556ACQ9_9BURK|nr:hypothetical protein [Verticiella sediminum]TSH90660.1 hypothetical protein FOZ76_22950 [Verticiella sediminum]